MKPAVGENRKRKKSRLAALSAGPASSRIRNWQRRRRLIPAAAAKSANRDWLAALWLRLNAVTKRK